MTNFGALLSFCEALATYLHAEDYDKHGKPYIGHCARVANGLPHDRFEARCAAWLHDTVEDGRVTEEALRGLGIPARVVDLVLVVTRREGETYMDYIRRVSTDSDAIEIKLSDLRDNQDPLRRPLPEGMVQRYRRAQALLETANERRAPSSLSFEAYP